jgi:3-oxoadipate enol-lactonase
MIMRRLATTAAVLTEWGIRGEEIARRVTGHGGSRPGVHCHEGGTGAPLVLLNGIGASGLVWPRAWVGELEQTHRVIRVDTRGTGWSRDAVVPFTIADLADDVVSVLDRAGVAAATVLGMSMGGMVAQELAVRHPGRVDRLVLVSTIPPAPTHVPTTYYGPLYGPMARVALSRIRSDRRAQAELLARLYLRTASRGFCPDPELIAELAEQLDARATPVAGLVAQARAVVAWRGPERLTTIGVPTTVVAGRDDLVVTSRNGELLAGLIPESRYDELAGVGHLVPWEAPTALLRILAT